jgi:hypothetical protein
MSLPSRDGPHRPTPGRSRTPRQVQHRLRSDEVEELLNRYRAGAKVGELATIFGIHRYTVSDILDRQGVARRPRGIPPECVRDVITSYWSGASLATIGAEMSVEPGDGSPDSAESGRTAPPSWRVAVVRSTRFSARCLIVPRGRELLAVPDACHKCCEIDNIVEVSGLELSPPTLQRPSRATGARSSWSSRS